MKKELGFARCGLACCVCGENAECAGCHSDGCKDRDWCKNRKCTMEKGLNGCWECPDFPCSGGMLDKPRIRAFAAYLKERGSERLMECLERNEQAGVQYHYPGKIVGDYDLFDTQQEVWNALENGLNYHGTIVKEGLSDENILDLVKIDRTELWRTEDQPRYWTVVFFSSQDARFPDKLSAALSGNWYADMNIGHYKIVVFPGKVMRYTTGDAKGKAEVQAYGRSIGIPDAQLDWAE